MSYYARLLDPFFSWLKLAVLHYLYRFSDGSKVQMDDNLAEELEDILDKRDPGMTGQHSLWQACRATAPFRGGIGARSLFLWTVAPDGEGQNLKQNVAEPRPSSFWV